MNTKEFLHSIPKSGKPISNQQDLIDDLTIALGLVEMGSKDQRERGAKIMMELTNAPIHEPANRITAVAQAKKNINISE